MKSASSYGVGITRIDQDEKKNHGYYVRLGPKGHHFVKYFADKINGGRRKALDLARAYRAEVIPLLPPGYMDSLAGRRPRASIPHSGVVGVRHSIDKVDGHRYVYWNADWRDAFGRRRVAKFSIAQYGNKTALRLAIWARQNKRRPSARMISILTHS